MATSLPGTDVVVIGLGAAGGVAVLPLAEAGLDIVGLEAGSRLTAKDFAPDELRNNVRDWPFAVQKAMQEIPTLRRNRSAQAFQSPGQPMMNGVGGTSLHYWGQSWRLNPWDFKVVSETTRRYGASRIPKGSTVEDWPFGYEELEPYYDRVEHEIGVSGQAGNLKGQVDQRGNTFEGARTREYPMPPLRWTGFLEKMGDAARSLNWKPFPGPAAVNSEFYQGRSSCQYHGFCSKGGCHVDAKNSTAVTTIPRAEETGRLKVVTHAHAAKIEVDNAGRVTGVTYLRGGEEFFQPARVVLLASYTYENVRLLLLSKSRSFPIGLSNNHAQVGRHYLSHHQGAGVSALFPFDLNAWYGLPAQGVAVDDWADDNFDHSSFDFIGGGNLWVYSDRRPIQAAGMNTFGRAPSWGTSLERVYQGERRPVIGRIYTEDDVAIRDELPRSGSNRQGPTRGTRDTDHRRIQGKRIGARRLHAGQDGAVVPRGRCGRGRPGWIGRSDGSLDPCLRWYTDGRQPRNQRPRPVWLLTRSAQSRSAWRLGYGYERRTQPYSDSTGSGLANGATPRR